jgi:peptidyl-prolyl cis-trans isomerase B (cyclophilin B)
MKSYLKVLLLVFLYQSFWSCSTKSKSSNPKEEGRKTIEMITDYGTMTIELYNETPMHRDNFINLAKNGAFDSLLFHRVIKDFMIQSGDPDSKKAKPGDALGEGDAPYRIDAEFNQNLFHKKGVLAAARDGNPKKASSSMQFYFAQGKVYNDSLLDRAQKNTNKWMAQEYFKNNPKLKPILDSLQKAIDDQNLKRYTIFSDSILKLAQSEEGFKPYSIPEDQRAVYKSIGGIPFLDQDYTVFGEVIKGIEVVDSIAKVQTDSLDRPTSDLRILKVKVIEKTRKSK